MRALVRALQAYLRKWGAPTLGRHFVVMTVAIAASAAATISLNGCSKAGSLNTALQNVSIGINLITVAGDQQSVVPNEQYPNPLVVQALDPITGKPSSGLKIQFTEITSTHTTIKPPLSPQIRMDRRKPSSSRLTLITKIFKLQPRL